MMNKKPLEAPMDQVSASRIRLGNPYAHLDGDGDYSALAPASTTEKNSNLINLSNLRDPSSLGTYRSSKDIELIVKSLHTEIWRNRGILFDRNESIEPIQMLDPTVALKAIGYSVNAASGLGQYDNGHGPVEVAGYIDSSKNIVGISNQFPADIRNFTAAHELGHALLHDAVGMHRDRALDGGNVYSIQDTAEKEANKFASLFLMPEKLVKKEFRARYHTERFEIDDNSTFLISNKPMNRLRAKVKNSRGLARLLAESERYDYRFISIKSHFKVSTEAMAIRLEELKLVKY